MNEKFFSLPEEKQLAIINAGYRVFSQNSYRKSPMSEIAEEADISKSLLFYYFRNKRELYLYLLDTAVETTCKYMRDYGSSDEGGFFDIIYKGIKAKVEMMKKHPDITAFTLKAYYETDPEVCAEIQEIIGRTASYESNAELFRLDPEKFVEGLDLQMMYTDIYFATEGYLWEKTQRGALDVEEAEKDFEKMIDFWKKIYLRKE